MSSIDQIKLVKTRRQEFTEYFIDEFEGKIKWLTKILEEKDESKSVVKDVISAGLDAITGSPKGVVDLLGSKLIDYIEDKKNKKKADRMCQLVYNFKDEKKRQELKIVLVEGCFDVFQSFEMCFMQVSSKIGGETRAMQKLAKQAAYNVFEYINTLKDDCPFTTEIITKGVTFERSGLSTFNETVLDDSIKLNTAKLYNKVGIVIENQNQLDFYKTKNSKGTKYGYRRLFQTEMKQKLEILAEVEPENPREYVDYKFVLSIDTLTPEAKEMMEYLNGRDPELMEERLKEAFKVISKDVIQELCNGIFQDLMGNIDKMTDMINELMMKLDSKPKPEPTVARHQININNNKVGTMSNHYH